MKLSTNVKHYQTRENKNYNSSFNFYSIMPLYIYEFGVRYITLKLFMIFSRNLVQMQIIRYITLKLFMIFSRNLVQMQIIMSRCAEIKNYNSKYTLYQIMPLCIFSCRNRDCSITKDVQDILYGTLYKC